MPYPYRATRSASYKSFIWSDYNPGTMAEWERLLQPKEGMGAMVGMAKIGLIGGISGIGGIGGIAGIGRIGPP